MSNKVLIIASVDSGGGAGITADCQTVHDLGAFPLPCTVAVTSQSLKQVAYVESVSDKAVQSALDLILSDWDETPQAVKVGFIPLESTLNLVLKFLEEKLPQALVVWDPVLTATAGRMESADLKKSLERILKITTIFTLNLPEALELAGWSEEDLEKKGLKALAQVFLDQGLKAILIKGGHRQDKSEAVDFFASSDLSFTLSYPKKAGDGAHGGGCALSSALASLLSQGYGLEDACVLAKAYITDGILKPAILEGEVRPPIGHHGFPRDLKLMPHVFEEGFPEEAGPFASSPLNMGLYPVVGDVETLQWLLALGVRTAQLRIKDSNDPLLFEKIKRAVFLGKTYKARVFIDDHYELAIKAKAYGVHLGMEDLKTADLKKIKETNLRLGVSTHGMYELLKAVQLKPSYIALGHIFETQTKKMKSKAQGVKRLRDEVELLNHTYPTVAIAGIKLSNLEGVLASGVGSVAVVTAITQDKDPYLATQKWLTLCGNGGDEI